MNNLIKGSLILGLLAMASSVSAATTISTLDLQLPTPNTNEKVTVNFVDFQQNDALMLTFAGVSTNGGLTTPVTYMTTFDAFVSDLSGSVAPLLSDSGANFSVVKVGSSLEFTAKTYDTSVNTIGGVPTDADEFDGFNPSISKSTTPQVAGDKQITEVTFNTIQTSDTVALDIDGAVFTYAVEAGDTSADVTSAFTSLINASGSSHVVASGMAQLVLTAKTGALTFTVANTVTPDVTIPVITLVGSSTVNLQVGDTYTDSGATASDNINGDITSSIVTGGTYTDTSASGTFTRTFNVTDAAGNIATTVTRTIIVSPAMGGGDTTAPVITLVGSGTVNLQVGDSYTDAGATASDNVDGNITNLISTGGTYTNTSASGTFTITYNVSDVAGNAATTVTRTINVGDVPMPDTIAPVITRLGTGTVTLTVGDSYTDAGATASDNIDGNLTSSIVVGGTYTNTSATGTFTITYNVSDVAGNAATTVTRTIIINPVPVPDTTAPVITLVGSGTVNLTVGASYTDSGATASDNIDGNLTSSIVVGGTYTNTSASGTFTITYNVSDVAGNAATTVTRTIIVSPAVVDTTAPVITLVGSATVNLTVGASYTDSGATASDNVDGNITNLISTGGTFVNTSNVGTFTRTFNVTDAAGNVATTVTRTIIVNPVGGSTGGSSGGSSGGGSSVISGGSSGGGSVGTVSYSTTSTTTTVTPTTTTSSSVPFTMIVPKGTKGLNKTFDPTVKQVVSNPTVEKLGGTSFAIGTTSTTPVRLNKRVSVTLTTTLPNNTKVRVRITTGKIKPIVATVTVRKGKIVFSTNRVGIFTVSK